MCLALWKGLFYPSPNVFLSLTKYICNINLIKDCSYLPWHLYLTHSAMNNTNMGHKAMTSEESDWSVLMIVLEQLELWCSREDTNTLIKDTPQGV